MHTRFTDEDRMSNCNVTDSGEDHDTNSTME